LKSLLLEIKNMQLFAFLGGDLKGVASKMEK
jgi:hypothetical protein